MPPTTTYVQLGTPGSLNEFRVAPTYVGKERTGFLVWYLTQSTPGVPPSSSPGEAGGKPTWCSQRADNIASILQVISLVLWARLASAGSDLNVFVKIVETVAELAKDIEVKFYNTNGGGKETK